MNKHEENKIWLEHCRTYAEQATHYYTPHTRILSKDKTEGQIEFCKKLISSQIQVFHNRLVKRLHGYDYSKKRAELEVILIAGIEVRSTQEVEFDTMHVHMLLGNLKGKFFDSTEQEVIKQLLDECWKKTCVFGNETHLRTTDDTPLKGLSYTNKGNWKPWLGDGVQFMNCWWPTAESS